MRRLTQLLALLSLLALAGCFGLPGTDGPENRCLGDADCADGVCNVDLEMCVTDARDEPLRIGLRVIPETAPFAASPLEVSFPPQLVDGPEERNLVLPVGVPVSGDVIDSLDGGTVEAQLIFRTDNLIPGRPAIELDPSTRTAVPGETLSYNVQTHVLPDTPYTIEVRPTGPAARALPPLRSMQPWLSPTVGESARLPELLLEFPERCTEVITTDCLATLDGAVQDSADTPQVGYTVRAIETATGRVISSTNVTDEEGLFTSVMPQRYLADPASWFFRVTPTADRAERVGPEATFTVEATNLYPEGLVRILAPSPTETIRYEGFVEDGDNETLANATLELEARDVIDPDTGVAGVYRASATTDEEGRFSVSLLPGTYEVLITPDAFADDGVAVLRQTVDLTEASGEVLGQLFSLPARTVVGGTVQTADSLPMHDAQVVATARNLVMDDALGDVASAARSNRTMTGGRGTFSLPLDIGLYDLTILPPTTSNFARTVVRDVPIGGAEVPLSDVYELQNPMTMTGTVSFDAEGARVPVANGRIEAYAVVTDRDGEERAVLVGEATIDEEGHYTLLLPPSI